MGKLIKKIKIIDVLFLAIIIAGIVFAMNFSGVGAATADTAGSARITYTIELKEQDEAFFDNIKTGAKLYDSLKGYAIGTITAAEKNPYRHNGTDFENDTLPFSAVEGLYAYHVTIEATADISAGKTMIGDYQIGIGKEMFVRNGDFASKAYCISISE